MKFQGELPELNLLQFSNAYLVGIKGVGMTALAVLLQQAGLRVSGADVAESFVTDETLQHHQIAVSPFDQAELPDDTAVVIYSGAHQGMKQPLVQTAQARQLPVLSLAQAVGLLSLTKQTIGVCGVGGKSTTSALVSWILDQAGWQPSFAVGVGTIPNLGTSARWQPDSEYFVVEADEYVADPQADLIPRFLYLRPTHLICTSLAYDHPDVYASFAETQQAYANLLALLPQQGMVVVNGDDSQLRTLTQLLTNQVITVGEGQDNEVTLHFSAPRDGQATAELQSAFLPDGPLVLTSQIPGEHNLRNAAYAATLCLALGVQPEVIQQAVANFRSVQRRFEYRGTTERGVRCYDDYAHHPRELRAVAETLRTWFPDQPVTVAFEPHTYSRTAALMDEFTEALVIMPGDVWLLPIFASARETSRDDVTSEQLVQALRERGTSAQLVPDYNQLLEYIQTLPAQSIFLTAGAGSIYKIFEHVRFVSA